MFTVMAFKNHLGSVGAVEDVASAVTGFMERHSSLPEDKDIGPPPIAPAMARSSVEPGSESSVKQPSNPFPVTLTRSPEYCPPSTTPNVDQLKLSPTTARRKQPIPFDRPPAPLPPEARSPEKRSHENEMVRHKSLPEVVSQSVVSSSNSDKDKPQYINVTASPSESSQYVNVPVRSPGQRLGQRAQSEDLQARHLFSGEERRKGSSPTEEDLHFLNHDLPSGWRAYWSGREGRLYYYNGQHNLSSWKKPTL